MANIMMTEKRAWAMSKDQIVLIQFLDETAVFDRTLHPNDKWKYFQLLHQNLSTHIKWNGNVSKSIIHEAVGNREGGYSSADEWKIYGNPMIKEIELHSQSEDYRANVGANVIAIADDVVSCASADSPR